MRKTAALCLFAIMAVAGNAFAGAEARMAGKVTDAVTKAPIPNVVVTVVSTGQRNFKADFKGDKNGEYRLLLVDGTLNYDFTFSAPGYQPFTRNMKLKLGDTTAMDVQLQSASAVVATAQAAPAAAAPAKPDPSLVAFNEGAALYNQGKHADAITKFEVAVAARPDLIAGWEALAKAYLNEKNYPKAIESANKALAIDPEESVMYTVLYNAYTATGDKAKAAEAKSKMPADAGLLFNDAAKLINGGKDSAAEPLLKQAIAANDKFAPAYYELGMLYVRAGKTADAKTNLQKYLELEPTGKDAATAKEMLQYVK
jgi:tetratricopeptide (TPR) repeat protein